MSISRDVRYSQPSMAMTVAAWNVQRGTKIEEIAAALRGCGASVVLLSECDIGMARSGNIDTVGEIAERLGMGHVFGVEFRERGLGNAEERRIFAGRPNIGELHGNAVLSKLPFAQAFRLDLDDGKMWRNSDQPRHGSRIAVVVRIGAAWFVSAHLESRGSAEMRAEEMRQMTFDLGRISAHRCVIGGDFNTKEGPDEPLFRVAAEAGLRWKANADEGRFKGRKLDWFFYRGVAASNPKVIDATDVSDHDLITIDVKI